jgi:hypothetical protein
MAARPLAVCPQGHRVKQSQLDAEIGGELPLI